NEIDQQQRDCAYCKRSRSRCFEDLPASESQHSHFPEPQSAVMKANSLCHRGVRATNGHLITPPRTPNELPPVHRPVPPVVPTEKIHTLTAGDCCTAEFRPGL